MSSVKEIYDKLFDGKAVTVACGTSDQFHSLRTALCKRNQIYVALDMTNGSIVGKFDAEKQRATYSLTASTRITSQNKWSIISIDEASNG